MMRATSGSERRAVARRKQRLLVDVDADAMPQAVAHLARETMLGKHVFGKFVRLLARHTRTKHGLHLLVRIANGSISRAKALRRLTEKHRARHVGAIPLRPRAEVHNDALPRFELRSAWDRMGTCTVLTARNDRGERQTLGSMANHEFF